MIPERLKPLLSRLKNSPTEHSDPWEAESHKQIAPTAIMLIEQGIDLHLAAKFQDDRKLEEFVLRAAMLIPTPSKEERKAHWVEYINKSPLSRNDPALPMPSASGVADKASPSARKRPSNGGVDNHEI